MELYKDPNMSISRRVEDLLSRMTLEEKCAQLCGDLPIDLVNSENLELDLRKRYPNGHGRFTQYSLAGLADPVKLAKFTNRLQKYFVEETRLGIPVALQTENLCGYPAVGGTLFPAQINVGCTWDPKLVEKMAFVIGQESRAVGINSAMSPVLDVSRDPRWGRVYETYGEDPYLVGQMGIHYIQGMQGEKKNGVACIAKHFLGYSESQGGLNTAVTRITKRELYEVFGTPFEAAMREADVSSVMASYSEIDGMCVCANREIAHDLLRDTMKFEGVLTSDGAGILKLFTEFHMAESYEEAGYLAKKAGTDTEIPIGGAFGKLDQYVNNGMLDEAVIDESVRRILRIKFEYGLFETPYVDIDRIKDAMANSETRKLSEEIAEKSIVLVKNESVLPLKGKTKLAVVGPHADSLRYPVSGYTFPAYVEMIMAGKRGNKGVSFQGMADEVRKEQEAAQGSEMMPNLFEKAYEAISEGERAQLADLDAVLRGMGAESLKDVLEKRFEVIYAEGCKITGDDSSGIPEAVKAARESDVVIYACGGNCGWVDATGGEGKDRSSLELPGVQQQLLEALCATGKKIVMVLFGPGIYAVPYADDHVDAVIQAFMPGTAAGKVVAAVLDGTVNPGGKLTMTIPRSVGQIPVTYNHRIGSGYISMTENDGAGIFSGGYIDEDNQPLFCFGHGLSYTRFELSDFVTEKKSVSVGDTIVVTGKVHNIGDREGDEVVQLYYYIMKAHVIRPVKQLAGFQRIHLEPGEEKSVTFRLSTAQMGYYNEEMEFVITPGPVCIMIGTSAHDIVYREVVELVGDKVNLMGKRSYSCMVTVTP